MKRDNKLSVILLESLKRFPFFNKKMVVDLGVAYLLKKNSIDVYISRYLQQNDIYKLKNGLYVTADFYNKNKEDISYLFYLANVSRTPSYISSWAALQYYGLVTEATYPITSVTLKVTRKQVNRLGVFMYQSISKKHFTEFVSETGKFTFFIASPAKALFDLLYFRTKQFKNISFENISGMVDELRIDFDEMSKLEQDKFYRLIKAMVK